jgi:magnesium-transporting ATPase (P-type)
MNDFFATLYEGTLLGDLFYIDGFSNDMFQANAYMSIGLIMLISSLLLEVVYYYFISNYGKFFKKRFWFLWILVIGILNFATAYYQSTVAIEDFYSTSTEGSPYSFTEHFTFSMVNVLWATIFCILFSLVLKIRSVRASSTPFKY